MTIKEYIKKYNITYRELAKRLGISATYLSDLSKGRRLTMSGEVANRFNQIAPEIEIILEQKTIYKVRSGERIS